jgi:4-diphosphocytidyl-2-C-methyl-D-erythritol kinase
LFSPGAIVVQRVLTITAPAKVNLMLGVGAVRVDGYHEVTTVLHALALADTIRMKPAPTLTIECDADVGVPPERNLAYKAACAFAEEFGPQPPVAIDLKKRIPSGAGLGGGSSDAAAVIAGLASLAGVDPVGERCLSVARSLGADCAFFLVGAAALMSGRGDRLVRILPPIAAHVAVVKPPASVPTAAAYAAFDGAPLPAGVPDAIVGALEAGDIGAVAAALENNMIAASSELVPEVAEALAWIQAEEGVLGASMAGSGSAVFALCEDALSRSADCRRIARAGLVGRRYDDSSDSHGHCQRRGVSVRVDAMVMAGGDGSAIDPEVRVKGFAPIAGRSMVEWVVKALSSSETVAEIAIVVPSDAGLGPWVELVDHVVISDGSFVDNMIAGANSFTSGRHLIATTGDIPALTPEAVDDFVRRSLATGADVSYPLVRASDMEEQFPGSKRTYLKVEGVPVTGGNVMLMSPELVRRNREIGQKLFDTRKSPIAMAKVIGLPFALKYLMGRLRAADVERKMAQLIGVKCAAIYTSYACIGADVDKPVDVVVAERVLYQRAHGVNIGQG